MGWNAADAFCIMHWGGRAVAAGQAGLGSSSESTQGSQRHQFLLQGGSGSSGTLEPEVSPSPASHGSLWRGALGPVQPLMDTPYPLNHAHSARLWDIFLVWGHFQGHSYSLHPGDRDIS